jgi:SAM-dependent methyltransferase
VSTSFEAVADEYEAGRPGYPAELFDAVEDLTGMFFDGLRVLDLCAGTGLATRELRSRGARAVALDHGPVMLRVLRSRVAGVPAVVGDANRLPFAGGSLDLVTCAQAWHWLDRRTAPREVARVLRDGGAFAVWWNIADPAAEPWFAEHRARLHALDGGAMLRQLVTAARSVAADFPGAEADAVAVSWARTVTKEVVLADAASKSYLTGLGPQRMQAVLDRERELLPDGELREPYVTELTVIRPTA